MLNAYYDFRNDSSFTPYVSAGLGYARIHHKTTDVYELKYYSSEETISDSRSDTDNNFAWSLGVGVKYNIYDNLSVDLAYRYFDAGKSQITYRNEWNEEFKSRVSVRSNDIMLGVTYDFWHTILKYYISLSKCYKITGCSGSGTSGLCLMRELWHSVTVPVELRIILN